MPPRRGDGRGVRWALPAGLLALEYLLLSFLIDLTGRPEARSWVAFYRVAAPVAIGTVAAGWLVARSRAPSSLREAGTEPPWRPWWALLGNLAALAAATVLAWGAFGPRAPSPPPSWALPALLVLGTLAAVFAAGTMGPASWLLRRARHHAGPLSAAFALGCVAWWVTASVNGAWGLLSTATLRSVGALLHATGGEVTLIPAELAVGLDGFEVEIAPECSGVDGIGLFLLFEGIWLALARDRLRFPRALLLLPLGAVAAFAANAFRIATLIWVGALGHEQVALGGLHSKLGWILAVVLAMGAIALAERTSWFHRPGSSPLAPGEGGGVPAEAGVFLGPLLAALATALLTGIWADGSFDRWYGARIVAAAAVLYSVRRSLPSLRPSRSWVPALIGAGVALVWIGAAGNGGEALASTVAGLGTGERWGWMAIRILGSIAIIPVIEELAFRGFLLPWLVSPDLGAVSPRAWTWPAVLFSSLAFGAVHSQFLLGALAGLAYAFARLWRGKLGDAVLAHAVTNAGVALAVTAWGRWGLWGY